MVGRGAQQDIREFFSTVKKARVDEPHTESSGPVGEHQPAPPVVDLPPQVQDQGDDRADGLEEDPPEGESPEGEPGAEGGVPRSQAAAPLAAPAGPPEGLPKGSHEAVAAEAAASAALLILQAIAAGHEVPTGGAVRAERLAVLCHALDGVPDGTPGRDDIFVALDRVLSGEEGAAGALMDLLAPLVGKDDLLHAVRASGEAGRKFLLLNVREQATVVKICAFLRLDGHCPSAGVARVGTTAGDAQTMWKALDLLRSLVGDGNGGAPERVSFTLSPPMRAEYGGHGDRWFTGRTSVHIPGIRALVCALFGGEADGPCFGASTLRFPSPAAFAALREDEGEPDLAYGRILSMAAAQGAYEADGWSNTVSDEFALIGEREAAPGLSQCMVYTLDVPHALHATASRSGSHGSDCVRVTVKTAVGVSAAVLRLYAAVASPGTVILRKAWPAVAGRTRAAGALCGAAREELRALLEYGQNNGFECALSPLATDGLWVEGPLSWPNAALEASRGCREVLPHPARAAASGFSSSTGHLQAGREGDVEAALREGGTAVHDGGPSRNLPVGTYAPGRASAAPWLHEARQAAEGPPRTAPPALQEALERADRAGALAALQALSLAAVPGPGEPVVALSMSDPLRYLRRIEYYSPEGAAAHSQLVILPWRLAEDLHGQCGLPSPGDADPLPVTSSCKGGLGVPSGLVAVRVYLEGGGVEGGVAPDDDDDPPLMDAVALEGLRPVAVEGEGGVRCTALALAPEHGPALVVLVGSATRAGVLVAVVTAAAVATDVAPAGHALDIPPGSLPAGVLGGATTLRVALGGRPVVVIRGVRITSSPPPPPSPRFPPCAEGGLAGFPGSAGPDGLMGWVRETACRFISGSEGDVVVRFVHGGGGDERLAGLASKLMAVVRARLASALAAEEGIRGLGALDQGPAEALALRVFPDEPGTPLALGHSRLVALSDALRAGGGGGGGAAWTAVVSDTLKALLSAALFLIDARAYFFGVSTDGDRRWREAGGLLPTAVEAQAGSGASLAVHGTAPWQGARGVTTWLSNSSREVVRSITVVRELLVEAGVAFKQQGRGHPHVFAPGVSPRDVTIALMRIHCAGSWGTSP